MTGALPVAARVYITAVALVAAVFAAPALGTGTPWGTVLVLATLHAVSDGGFGGNPSGRNFSVLLAAALILPPAAAALVALPGSFAARVGQRPRWVRRGWRAAQLAVATGAAGEANRLCGGKRALAAVDLPYALLPAAAAALAFCLVSTALVGGVLVLADRCPPEAAWHAPLLGSLAPHLTYGMVGLMMAVLWQGPYGAFSAVLVLLPMYIACWVFAQVHRERAAHQATVRALVQAVEIKDRYTRGHSERVGRASALIAREIGMADDRVDALRFAGILHDVGKLGIPTRLLRKEGPLTPQERRLIELHPEYGHEMVRGIAFLDEARAAILHHHERVDGRGYPCGLAADQIPEFARVVAVADAFDAMTSTRSYRRAKHVDDAVAELHRCAGTQFDPVMVQALARALDREGWSPAVTADEPSGPGEGGGEGGGDGTGEAAGAGAGGAEDTAAVPGPRPRPQDGTPAGRDTDASRATAARGTECQ